MTKILITYHMHAGPYEDETAIVLPMTDDKAREILGMNDPNVGDVTIHEINLLELAALIASSKDMRDAAKLAAVLEQIHTGKQLSTVIEEICEGE